MFLTFGHTFGVRVLRIDRPDGRRVLKFDAAYGCEGCGGALRAQIIRKRVRR